MFRQVACCVSVRTLRQYATWAEMQRIFKIEGNEWSEFTSRHGKGITRALRNLTGGKFDALVYWNNDDIEWADDDWSNGKVYVDGQALKPSVRLLR